MPGFREEVELESEVPTPSGMTAGTGEGYQTLLVSDLGGTDKGSVGGAFQSGIVNITAETFDELMRSACPSVNFTASDPLAPGGAMVEIVLRFDSMRALDPKQIAQQLPATKGLAAFREKLVARLLGKATAADLNRAASGDASLAWAAQLLKWTPSAAAETSSAAADAVLSQIDLGDGAAAPKTPMSAVIAAAAGAGATLPAEEASAVRRTLAEADRRLGVWLSAVLHSGPVQALEAAWRGLKLLVTKTEFRKGARLAVLHAPGSTMLERVRTLLVDPVFDQGADAPDLIVVDSQFGNSAPDIEALDELAQHAASLPAVVLAGVGPGFFGVKHAWQIPTLPALVSMFDQWQFAKWKTLRGQGYAKSLGVVFGRSLLRVPYGPVESAAELDFAYREPVAGDGDCVWTGGAIPAACAVSQSVGDTGWPTAMAGFVHGRVEGFASAHVGPKGEKKIGPTDTLMPLPKIQELAVAGINAAVGIKDHDDVIVWNGLSAGKPPKFDQHGLLEISLPYQLFASRLAHLLFGLKPQLHGMSGEKVGEFIKQHACEWLTVEGSPAPAQVAVQTRAPEGNPAGLEFALTVTPPERILPGAIPMVLGYRIR